ncbi:MAG: transcription initiation factor IIA gamma subunit [Amphiamblys sp. WSBS2006]|nr:MAG: transcription initiation factor IIA gamma subunit [Amphiamblys sp. WSBS2006]
MTYEIYRGSTLGVTLANTLDEMVQSRQITAGMALRVLMQFDYSIHRIIADEIRTKGVIKGKLETYRFFDDVWTFVLRDVRFKIEEAYVTIDSLKIVACNTRRD